MSSLTSTPRMQICADGATSRLATHLGYCTEPPRGVCSRAFVEGGTHNTDFDGERRSSGKFQLCGEQERMPLCRISPAATAQPVSAWGCCAACKIAGC